MRVDVILTSTALPAPGACAFMRALREEHYAQPILLIAPTGNFEDKVTYIQSGADDCLIQPYEPREVPLRVKALLRWRFHLPESHVLNFGELVVDHDALTVRRADEQWMLPKKEMEILCCLLCSPGHTFTRSILFENFWDPSSQTNERTIDVHIKRLRQKFGHLSEFQIITVRGYGYRAELNTVFARMS